MPEEYVTPPARSTSVLRFVVIAIVLIALLVAGFYFGKQYLDTQREATVTTSSDKKENKQKSNSDSDKQKENEQRERREAEQAEAKREEEAKKKAEAERRQAQSPTTLPGDTAPSSSSPDQQVATTGPHEVASTGPEDALIALTGVLALVYAAFTFVRSRQALSHSLDKSLQARK